MCYVDPSTVEPDETRADATVRTFGKIVGEYPNIFLLSQPQFLRTLFIFSCLQLRLFRAEQILCFVCSHLTIIVSCQSFSDSYQKTICESRRSTIYSIHCILTPLPHFKPFAMSSKKKADKKAKHRSSISIASATNTAKVAPANQGGMTLEPQPDHSLCSPYTLQNASQSSITIQMNDPASSPQLNAASLSGYRASPDIMQDSLAHVDHQHPEPSIGERFGRRHGQDWPARTDPSGSKCSSCPGSRSESRSMSRGGMRRTSGVLYKAIPVRPVIGAHVFQSARKSKQAINAIKGKSQVQEFYRTQVSGGRIKAQTWFTLRMNRS